MNAPRGLTRRIAGDLAGLEVFGGIFSEIKASQPSKTLPMLRDIPQFAKKPMFFEKLHEHLLKIRIPICHIRLLAAE